MLGARNLELQLSIESAGQASQLDIPARPDSWKVVKFIFFELVEYKEHSSYLQQVQRYLTKKVP